MNYIQGTGVNGCGSGYPARYASFRRAGDLVIFAGIVAADATRGIVIKGYADLPPDLRKRAAGRCPWLIQFFMHTGIDRQGRPYIARQTSMKGDYVELLALTDVLALPNMCSANIKASIARM